MSLYTILLVDDEEALAMAVMRKINWEQLGFSIIGYAENGVKALEMMEEFHPDVVMTDIRMPYMDGIALSRHIRQDFPGTKIMFFSGFDEFEYAKEAIHLEIEDYILKPLDAEELTEVLAKLKEKLDLEIHEKRNVQLLQEQYMQSLPFLKANFYVSLIEGKIREDRLEKYLSDYQITLPGPYFCCIVIYTSDRKIPAQMNYQLLSTSVSQQAENQLKERWKAKSFSYLNNMIMIAQFEQKSDVSELTDDCDRFCRYVSRMIGAVVTIGIGHVCRDIMEISESYRSAREAVSYRVLYGSMRAINIQEIAPQEMNSLKSTNDTEVSYLLRMILLGTQDQIVGAVKKYFEKNIFPTTSLQQYHIVAMELMSSFYRFAVSNDILDEEFLGEVNTLRGGLLELEADALQEWAIKTSLLFHEQIVNARMKSAKSFIYQAKDYVHSHYQNDRLSLDDVCDFLGVSNSYFSTMFKKEVGQSFVEYLTSYRLEQAEKLLRETNEKNYIIAQKVGYMDPNYFSYVFKRKFGISPSKYRTEYGENER